MIKEITAVFEREQVMRFIPIVIVSMCNLKPLQSCLCTQWRKELMFFEQSNTELYFQGELLFSFVFAFLFSFLFFVPFWMRFMVKAKTS